MVAVLHLPVDPDGLSARLVRRVPSSPLFGPVPCFTVPELREHLRADHEQMAEAEVEELVKVSQRRLVLRGALSGPSIST